MEASIFRSQALSNSHPLQIVNFSASSSTDELREKVMRDLINTRRGMPRLVPADNGFPVWHALVQGFLEEVRDVVHEVFGDWPEGSVCAMLLAVQCTLVNSQSGGPFGLVVVCIVAAFLSRLKV
jgi:cyanate lyase